ncbi:MAG: hypothetical protein HUU02_10295 [Bacteroidetes bacterium]|nr:hypothetical protein [Bacteroidota bacterium]
MADNSAVKNLNLIGAGTVVEGKIRTQGSIRVDGKLTGEVLTPAAAAFRLKVQRFRRTDDFHVYTIGLRSNDRIFHRTIRTHGPKIVGLSAWAPLPPNRPTMRMM